MTTGPLARFSLTRFSEQHNTLLCVLGSIHCCIGILEENISRLSICGINGNTNTGSYGKNNSIKLAGFGNPSDHSLCKASHVGFLLHVEQQSGKFVASPATDYVFIAYKSLQTICHHQ